MGSMNMNSLKLPNMAFTAPIFTKPIISKCHDVKIHMNFAQIGHKNVKYGKNSRTAYSLHHDIFCSYMTPTKAHLTHKHTSLFIFYVFRRQLHHPQGALHHNLKLTKI